MGSGRQHDSSSRHHQEESKEEKLIILESEIGLPFPNKKTVGQYDIKSILYQVTRQLCLCLYWLKFGEDRQVYFTRGDIEDRI